MILPFFYSGIIEKFFGGKHLKLGLQMSITKFCQTKPQEAKTLTISSTPVTNGKLPIPYSTPLHFDKGSHLKTAS